jgi:hypothetical protein
LRTHKHLYSCETNFTVKCCVYASENRLCDFDGDIQYWSNRDQKSTQYITRMHLFEAQCNIYNVVIFFNIKFDALSLVLFHILINVIIDNLFNIL